MSHFCATCGDYVLSGEKHSCIEYLEERQREIADILQRLNPVKDCTPEVMEHKRKVEHWMNDLANWLRDRAAIHDDSKLEDPEKSIFDRFTWKLKKTDVTSDEYKVQLAGMGEGLKHHYAHNRHHPEHFLNGVNGMTLIDVVEMLCDWIAACEEKRMAVNLDYLCDRFKIDGQLRAILTNTLRDIDYWNEVNGVPVIYFCPPTSIQEGA